MKIDMVDRVTFTFKSGSENFNLIFYFISPVLINSSNPRGELNVEPKWDRSTEGSGSSLGAPV